MYVYVGAALSARTISALLDTRPPIVLCHKTYAHGMKNKTYIKLIYIE